LTSFSETLIIAINNSCNSDQLAKCLIIVSLKR
jgi:hypothetical protein